DGDGNVMKKTEPIVKRQVISEKTASIVSNMMEQVVSVGTGKNAYVAGYHVAGKTGTSEKIGHEGAYPRGRIATIRVRPPMIRK
nr:penicillin-binding transpeptidase domain-containing protein [Candidatus Fimenecus sp.]